MIGGRRCAQRFKGGGSLERLERQAGDGGGWTNQTVARLPEHAVGWRCPSVTLIAGRHAYPQARRHYGPARAAPAARFPRSTPGGRQEHVYGEAGARRPARWISVRSVSKQVIGECDGQQPAHGPPVEERALRR